MTKVDFYIMENGNDAARFRLACRIASKAYGLGHRIHLHAGSPADTTKLDELLWTFRDQSFIPHEVQPGSGGASPVTIGHEWEPERGDVLINLADEVPIFFSRFERVAEIIDEAPATIEAGRERFRYYKERGYALDHHRISAT